MLERILLVALTPLALAGGTASSWVQAQWQARQPFAQPRPGMPARPGARLVLVPAADGMLHTIVRINGVAVDMIVDTGATRTILSEADARRVFGSQASLRRTLIRTLGGDRELHLRTAAAVEIGGKAFAGLDAGTLNQGQVSVIGLDWLGLVGPITIVAPA